MVPEGRGVRVPAGVGRSVRAGWSVRVVDLGPSGRPGGTGVTARRGPPARVTAAPGAHHGLSPEPTRDQDAIGLQSVRTLSWRTGEKHGPNQRSELVVTKTAEVTERPVGRVHRLDENGEQFYDRLQ